MNTRTKLRAVEGAAIVLLAAGCRDPRHSEPVHAAPQAHTSSATDTPTACATEAPRFEGVFPRAPSGVPEVDAAWLATHRCGVRVVDVREAEELAGPLGRIEGAEGVPLGEVEEAAGRWSRDEPIVLVCRSGRRSERAVATLEALGFRRVASLTGGILGWNAAQRPVVHAPPPAAHPHPVAHVAPHEAPSVQTPEALRQALGRPGGLVWTRAASLLGANTVACIDGRADSPVLGTPGGDAGELVLSLSALESELGRPLDAAWIAAVFDRYVASFGRFYLHTDHHALDRLGAALRADARTAQHASRLTDAEAVLAFVRHPPADAEAALLDHLARPESVGCGHLRLMMQHPTRYGVRAGIVADVMRAVFNRAWRRPELLDYAALEGEHVERGVLEVRIDHAVHAHSLVPMVVPHEGTRELFVLHPQVADFLRAENAAFLTEQLEPAEARRVHEGALRSHIQRLGARQLQATVQALAPHLPHYALRAAEGSHAITAVSRTPAAE